MVYQGIILAGGQSNRMGQDKGLVKYKGKRLVEYAIDLLTPFCERIVISSNNHEYKRFGLPVVEDVVKGIGPAGGLLTTLPVTDFDFNIIVSCDMPFLNNEAVNFLIENIKDKTCYIPVHSRGTEPLFGIYNSNFVPALKNAIKSGNYKLNFVLDDYGAHYVDFNSLIRKIPRLFDNFNHISDLNS